MRFLGNVMGRQVYLCTVEEYKEQRPVNKLGSYFIIEDDNYKVISNDLIVGIYDSYQNSISWFNAAQKRTYEPIRPQEESHVAPSRQESADVAEQEEEDYFAQFTAPVDSFFAGLLKSEN